MNRPQLPFADQTAFGPPSPLPRGEGRGEGSINSVRLPHLDHSSNPFRWSSFKLNVVFPAFLCLSFLCSFSAFAQLPVLGKANALERSGNFIEASALLTATLNTTNLTATIRKQLEFELDRLERIKKDFPFTEDQLFAELKKSIKGLTFQEFVEWVNEGRFDSREIDGRRRFMVSSVSNLFFRYPELGPRRTPPKVTAALDLRYWESCQAIEKAALAEHKPYVLPKRFDVRMSVKANANAAPEGQLIRAWLPVPRVYPFQTGFELLSSASDVKHIDDERSPIRSVLLEKQARKNRPTDFQIEYDYTAYGVRFDLKPEVVQPCDSKDPMLAEFTREAAHVIFTTQIKSLSQELAAGETNPYLKAKKFYDWIADHIQYSFAIEYSTIRNISEYCRSKGYGDCGQEALLFITLCRLNDIPARWQSGWNTFPGAKSIHDWTEIYLTPYGWIPVDPYMGIYAMRYATSLKPEQQRQIRDFYFGGLDQYRMIANSDHNQTLTPPKLSLRSDNVDFQRGELEWGNHNIYFDQYSYELTVKEVQDTVSKRTD